MKHNILRKLISLSLTALVILALPIQVLADEYDLAEGSVTVHASEGGQTVTHKSETKQDSNPVIKQSNNETPTTNTITVKSEGGATAKVTIDSVNIKTAEGSNNPAVVVSTSGERSKAEVTLKDSNIDTSEAKKNTTTSNGIDVQGTSDVTLNLEGDNTVTSRNQNNAAAVHVGGGNLTIQGDGSLTASGGVGAAIGTNSFEDLTGSITIGGDAKVNAVIPEEENLSSTDNMGAGIGTGYRGDITETGVIHITDQAEVTVSRESRKAGAGIGSGNSGYLSGTITINGNAQVNGTTTIGSGIGGDTVTETGQIIIGGNADVTAEGSVGIGGEQRLYGSVTIQDDAKVDTWGFVAGIGGMSWREGASVTIQDSTEVISGSDHDVAIGASTTYTKDNTLDIQIKGDAKVTANGTIGAKRYREDGESKPWTAPEDFPGFDSTATINGVKGDDINGLYWAGVLSLDPEDPRIIYPQAAAGGAGEEELALPLYWVTDGEGKVMAAEADQDGDTLTITADAGEASLVAPKAGLAALGKMGVKTIVFVTSGASSSFAVGEALGALAAGNLVLAHQGSSVSLTLGGVEHNELVK